MRVLFSGLRPGRERQSPQERRLCAEIPCLAAGLGERAASDTYLLTYLPTYLPTYLT